MKKWIIHCNNHLYVGCYSDHAAIAETEEELEGLASNQAYETFLDMGCQEQFYEENLGEDHDWEDEDALAEQIDEAYYYEIKEFDPEEHGKFEWYELLYDASKDN